MQLSMERTPPPVTIFSIWTNFQLHSSRMQSLLQGLVKMEFGNLIFVKRIMPSFPGYVSVTLTNGQCDRGMLPSRTKARSFCFRLRWTLFYFLRICNVGRYPRIWRLQNIFVSSCTAFQRVLFVTWSSLIVYGLKYKGCFPKLKWFGVNTLKSFKSPDICVSGWLFNVASIFKS